MEDPRISQLALEDCQLKLTSAKDEYRQIKKEAVEQRETWLEELAGALAA